MRTRNVYIMMVFSSLLSAGAFITGKLAVVQFPPFALTFFRFLIAAIVIFGLLRYWHPEEWKLQKREIAPLLLLGFIGIFMYHVLFFSCLKYTTAINSSLIAAVNPMVTAIIAAIFLSDKLTPLRITGIALSFIGVVCTVTNGDWRVITGMTFNFGDILMLMAVLCWAVYGVLNRRVMDKYGIPPIKLNFYAFVIGCLLSLPMFLREQPASFLPQTTFSGWLSIIYMAVCSSVMAYVFFSMAIREIGAPRTAIFVNLIPVFAIILSVTFLGEGFGWIKLMSTLLIILGVYLTTKPVPNVVPNETISVLE